MEGGRRRPTHELVSLVGGETTRTRRRRHATRTTTRTSRSEAASTTALALMIYRGEAGVIPSSFA